MREDFCIRSKSTGRRRRRGGEGGREEEGKDMRATVAGFMVA